MSVLSADDGLWFRRYHPSPTATARLVCFPHAGGSAPFYLPVATALSPDVDVIAIQYPGRQERRAEQPLTDVDTFAERIHDLLLRQPPLPVTFFGHSLGATIAFETVCRLEAGGGEVAHLFASGRRAPSAHREASDVHLRDDDGILAEVRRLNGTVTSVLGDQELMRAALPSLRADYQAAETYRCAPEATIDCPVTVLTGDSDTETTLPEAHAWERHTTSTCTVRMFPGGHFFITAHVNAINALLVDHFARTAGSDRGTAVRP
jgi:surfactin synthase thioesterase subunit